jgi:hypothetical protein
MEGMMETHQWEWETFDKGFPDHGEKLALLLDDGVVVRAACRGYDGSGRAEWRDWAGNCLDLGARPTRWTEPGLHRYH